MGEYESKVEAFEGAMLDAAVQCKKLGYNPTIWLGMISESGAVEAAKRLLRGSRFSYGFERLWEKKRLDLSVEYYVLLPEYGLLFSEDEREEARKRLAQYGFTVE